MFQVGASGSLFGLLAVQLVELLQGWKWIKKPCIELTKLLIFYVVLLGRCGLYKEYNFQHNVLI